MLAARPEPGRAERAGRSPRARSETQAGDVIECWIDFETGVARGEGHMRIKKTAASLDAADDDAPSSRAMRSLWASLARWAPSTAPSRVRKAGRRISRPSRRLTRPFAPALLPHRRRRPGRRRAGRAAAPARRPDDRCRQEGAPRGPVAPPVQVPVPARPGLVRPPAVSDVSRQLAGVLAERQDRRLAGVVRQGDGAQLLAQHRGQERLLRRDDRRMDRRRRAERRVVCYVPGSWFWPPDVRQGQYAVASTAWAVSTATSTTPPRTRDGSYRGKRCVVIGSNNSALDICGALWETAPT